MSSISPMVAQKVGEACAEKGVQFLDAPVSGGEPKASMARWPSWWAAIRRRSTRCCRCFSAWARSATLTGAVGAGNVTKLANQIMVACNIAAMGEALVLATKAGLDPEVVFNAVKGGLAGSTVLNAKAPMVIGRNFKPGFRIRLHQKDLRNALLAAESLKVLAAVHQPGTADAGVADEQRQGRSRSFGHRHAARRHGPDRSEKAKLRTARVLC